MIGLPRNRLHPQKALLRRLKFALYRGFKVSRRQVCFGTIRGLTSPEAGDILYRFVFVVGNDFLARLIALHMKPAMHNTNQRNELAAVVLDEKDVFVAHFEFWRIAHSHCFAVNGATEHSDGITLTGSAFEGIFHFESYVADDVPLRAFTHPLRLNIRNTALENNLGLSDKLIKGWRDYGCGLRSPHADS